MTAFASLVVALGVQGICGGGGGLYVEWGSTNTTDTSVFMMKISHILKCEGK